MQQKVLDVVVVFSSNFDTFPQPISLVAPSSLIVDNVQAMLDMALVKQKEETQTMVNEAQEKQYENTR